MTAPRLVLVSGPPASGKTTVARRIGHECGLPMVAKDAIKERLFDTLGTGDRAWTQRLGRASIALLWDWVEAHLQADCSVLAESNFHATADAERLAALRQKYAFAPVQIHCTASADVLWERFVARDHSGDRHPGHVGPLTQGAFRDSLRSGVWNPLRVDGPTLTLDTTDWAALDLAPAFAVVRA